MSSKSLTPGSTSGAAGNASRAASPGPVVKDSTGRVWTRGEWFLRTGPWRIAKSFVAGKALYVLTHDARSQRWSGVTTAEILGIYGTAAQAMEAAK